MLTNYLLVTIRNLFRNKLSTLINISGLGLAIGCCITFYQIIQYETSFDHFHRHADSIYRVILDWSGRNDSGHVHFPAPDALKVDFPDFEQITFVHGPVSGKISVVQPDGHVDLFKEDQVLYADATFLKTFDFKSITPVASTTLQKPNEVLLTASLARKYFADRDPIGKTIRLHDTELTIAGILEDHPYNTNLPFRMIVSYATFDCQNKEREGWLFAGDITVYVTLRPGDGPDIFRQRLETFTKKHVAFYKEGMYSYDLQPLKQVHTSTGFVQDWNATYYVPEELIWLPSFLGILIIVTGSINFMNLSIAQIFTLTKETSMRKVAGSSKVQLLTRFLLQSSAVIIAAMLLGLLIGYILLNKTNQLFAMINYDLSIDIQTLFFVVCLGAFILLSAGLYPASILTNLRSVAIFRRSFYSARSHSLTFIGKALIVFQISSSLILLVSTIFIAAQINFWKNSDLFFRTNDIVTFPVPEGNLAKKESLRNSLAHLSGLQNTSFSCFPPQGGFFGGAKLVDGTIPNVDVRINLIDEHFPDLYDLKGIAGKSIPNPSHLTILINEELAHALEFSRAEDAVGNNIELAILPNDKLKGSIGAVFHDFVVGNPIDAKIQPYAMVLMPEKTSQANLALTPHALPDILGSIQTVFNQIYPDEIFIPWIMTNKLEESYELESLIHKAVEFISCLSILISCIGIVGIINFMVDRRRKELCVRRVVGANDLDIVRLFLKEFAPLIITGIAIGAPMGAYLLQRWLQGYPHHLPLHAVYFLVALLVVVLITLVTIVVQVRMLSRMNTAEILRAE